MTVDTVKDQRVTNIGFKMDAGVVDLAPFCEWAEEYSNQVYDGIGMLVNQAALSFNHWFGSIPETNSVIKDIEGLSK